MNLLDSIKSVVDLLIFQAKKKGVDIIIRNKASSSVCLTTDETRLKQILINLVGNALKFTAKGSITILIEDINFSRKKIHLNAEEKRLKGFLLKVIDTGIGIKKNDIEHLFHDFSTVNDEQSIKMNKNGVGLGLMISQKLVRALNSYRPGGEINVESEVGKGSIFYFPLYDMEEQMNPSSSQNSYHSENIPSENSKNETNIPTMKFSHSCSFFSANPKEKAKRVLIVDDDELNLFVLSKNLSSLQNFHIDKAHNGKTKQDDQK